jgi:hypothetical protein
VEKLLEIYETTLLSNGFTDFDLQIKWAMKLVEDEAYVRGFNADSRGNSFQEGKNRVKWGK